MEKEYLRPSQIMGYYNYLKNEKEVPLDFIENKGTTLKEALEKGTSIHLQIENYLKGNQSSFTLENEWIKEELDTFLPTITTNLEELLLEQKLEGNVLGLVDIKGTSDAIYIDHQKQTIIIMDWKTNKALSDKAKDDYKIQMGIYGMLAKQQFNLPDYSISARLVWLSPSKKLYAYRFNYTKNNIGKINEIVLEVYNNWETIFQKKEDFKIFNEQIINKIQEAKISIDPIKKNLIEINKLKAQIKLLETQNSELIEEIYNYIPSGKIYNFVIDNGVQCSSYNTYKVNYDKVFKLIKEKYDIDKEEILTEANAVSSYIIKKVDIWNE